MIGLGKVVTFAAGALFGTAGVKALSSKDAKNIYVKGTAMALRVKDCVMETVINIQAGAEDIYAEAKALNAEREAKEAATVVEEVIVEEDEVVEEE